MFLCGVRKNICTALFLDTQELDSWSTLKANVCIFLYISLKKSSFRNVVMFYVVVGGMGGDWINFLRWFTVWDLQNVLQFFILIKIFENTTIFSISILLFIALKRWNFPDNLNFKGRIGATFLIRSSLNIKQYNKKKKQKTNKLIMGPFKNFPCVIHQTSIRTIEKEEKELRKEERKRKKESQQRKTKLEEDNLKSDEEQEEVLYCFWTFEANILIFKGPNFQISLEYLSVLDLINVNKSALFDFFTIFPTNILSNGSEISNINGNFRLESGIQEDWQNGVSLL